MLVKKPFLMPTFLAFFSCSQYLHANKWTRDEGTGRSYVAQHGRKLSGTLWSLWLWDRVTTDVRPLLAVQWHFWTDCMLLSSMRVICPYSRLEKNLVSEWDWGMGSCCSPFYLFLLSSKCDHSSDWGEHLLGHCTCWGICCLFSHSERCHNLTKHEVTCTSHDARCCMRGHMHITWCCMRGHMDITWYCMRGHMHITWYTKTCKPQNIIVGGCITSSFTQAPHFEGYVLLGI